MENKIDKSRDIQNNDMKNGHNPCNFLSEIEIYWL